MTKFYIIKAVDIFGDQVFYLSNHKTLGETYSFVKDNFNIMESVDVTLFTTLSEVESRFREIDFNTSKYKDFMISEITL